MTLKTPLLSKKRHVALGERTKKNTNMTLVPSKYLMRYSAGATSAMTFKLRTKRVACLMMCLVTLRPVR